MKVSFVSSQAISQALRYQTQRMQVELDKATKEVQSLRVADVGLALGARTGMSVSLHREVSRLNGLIDTNQLASTRLDATQVGLRDMTELSNQLLTSLTTASANVAEPKIIRQQADAVLSTMTAILNTNLNGEYLFAGINTDVKPFNDFLDPTSPISVAIADEFAAFTFSSPITDTEMNAFLDSIETYFTGPDWSNWSQATDERITTRITLTETAQTSVSANIMGIRKLAQAAATVSFLAEKNLSNQARQDLLDRALSLSGEALADFANQQGHVGVVQQKIISASERMSMQVDLFSKSIGEMEGIDPYEASTKVTGLMAQIEISYSLTAQMQQMSLLKYLS